MEITFSNPVYLWGLLIIPVLVVLYFVSLKYSKAMTLKFANFIALSRIAGRVGESYNISVLLIRIGALTAIILSISGMTLWYYGNSANKDYILAIDNSASMSVSENFMPNRLDAVKQAAVQFVNDLPFSSQVGVISFSGTSFVEQTLTSDKLLIKESINKIHLSSIGGTDIGDAIITSTNILLPGKKAKVIVLLTDGRSNIGVSDETAILYANTNHVVIHTIGIGSKNPENINISLGVDEDALRNISSSTLGNHYLVTDTDSLNKIYSQIIKNSNKGNNPINLSFLLLIIALILLVIDWGLGATIYRRVP